jgi:hypothetical protein
VQVASSSKNSRQPYSLTGLIESAGFVALPEVKRLQDFAAAVQQHRFDIGASPHTETTRSTALWSSMKLDDQIRTSLEDSKISMAKLARNLSLTIDTFTTPASTFRLHDDFADAMTSYLRHRARSGPVGLAEVVLAILLAARDSTSGVIGARIGSVDTAIVKMSELAGVPSSFAFDPREFSESVRELRRAFSKNSTVTPGLIATELQRSEAHADYAGGQFTRKTFASTGAQAPFEEWCLLVRGLYKMELVRSSTHHVIDGRLFLIGLAHLDADFAAQLKAGGLLKALRSEVSVPIEVPRPAAQVGELKGGISSEYVDPTKGISLARDQLGAAKYVSMLATVICDPTTPTPLSVGLFGEWGSGKSFFMGLLRGQIDEITGKGNDQYLHDIRQISFNAWHYTDSNLWASLGDEIFRQLLEEKDPYEERQQKLRAELGELNTQRRELEAVAEHAEAEAGRLRDRFAQASADRDVRAQDLLSVMEKTDVVKDELQKVWRRLGIKDPIEQARILAAEVRGTVAEAAVIRRSLAGRRGLAVAVLAVVVFLLVVSIAVWPTTSLESVVRSVTAAAGTLLASAVAVAASTWRGLARLRRLMDQLRTGAEQKATERTAQVLAEPLQALRDAEAARDLAQTQLTTVVARVGELGRELSELAPGQRLYGFLAERIEAGVYTRSLGLISTIRKDFERLIALMAEWRAATEKAKSAQQAAAGKEAAADEPDEGGLTDNPGAGGEADPAKRAIDRIVLYIDDLDRCSPKQVVEVLQAVHLLMALDLFVVVVGVDPRWLVRALQDEYPRLLDSSRDNGTGDDGWDASPEDYLEKIFGIPLVLPGMTKGTLDGILRGIMAVDQRLTSTNPVPAPSDNGTRPADGGQEADGTMLDSEERFRVAAPTERTMPPPPPRLLSNSEIMLMAALEPLVGTPREAKRLANIYRMLRATRDLCPASRFMGDDGQPGEHQAVVLLLGLLTTHALLLGAVLDSPADVAAKRPGGLMTREAGETWSEFVAGMEPRGAGDAWSNDFVATITPSDRLAWQSLWAGLQPVTELVTLPDLSALQRWAPRIRRFSFVISPAQVSYLRGPIQAER